MTAAIRLRSRDVRDVPCPEVERQLSRLKFGRFKSEVRSTIETKQGMETAFDMYAGPTSESIQHFEETILEIAANEPSSLP